VIAKIIVFTQMRDALRETSPKLFKSEQHRQDVLMTFLEALSSLEDELEEEEDEEEEELNE
jgi:type III secretion protein W